MIDPTRASFWWNVLAGVIGFGVLWLVDFLVRMLVMVRLAILVLLLVSQVAAADELKSYAMRSLAEQKQIIEQLEKGSIPDIEKKLEFAKKGRLGKRDGVTGSNHDSSVFFYEGHKVSYANGDAKRAYVAAVTKELESEKEMLNSHLSGKQMWKSHLPPGRPAKGSVGRLPYTAKIIQVLGEAKALVEMRLLPVDPSEAEPPILFMISGVDFVGAQETTEFRTGSVFIAGDPETYRTILGAERSAFTLTVVPDESLNEAFEWVKKIEAGK